MKHLLYFTSFIFLSLNSFSADYTEKYFQYYSTELHGIRIRNAENGGFYILANVRSENRLDYLYKLLIKTDSLGNQLWNTVVDGQEGPPGHMNSDFTLSGDTFIYAISHFLGCYSEGSIIKLDRSGNEIYNTEVLGLTYPDSKLTSICTTSNNDQLIGGYISQGSQCAIRYPFFGRMNPNGTFTWTTNLDTLIYSGISITGLSNYSDSSYIVNLSNSTSILVNDSGQIIPSNLPLGNFSVTTFSNYIIRHSDYFEKVDSSLTPIWQIPAFTDVTILDLTTNQSGSIFISGKKDTCNGEMFIAAYDSSGNNLWTKSYGGDLNDAGECILDTDQNHIVSIGTHSIHEWSVHEHISLDCFLYVTHTAQIRLIKLPNDILTSESVNSSTGRYDICPGDSIILTAPAGFSYLWNTGETSQSITVDSTGLHSVTIADLAGKSEPLPEFNAYRYPIPNLPQTSDVTYTQCSGNFDFCAGFPYNDSIYDRDYNWYSSAVPYPVSTDPTLGDPYNGLPAATYFCVVSNVCGSDTSTNYNLLAIAPTVSLGPDTILCNNDSLLLSVNTSALFADYTWQDGSYFSRFWATDTTMNSVNVYTVIVDDQSGCTGSDSVIVTFDNCTSVSEIAKLTYVYIYPNPFSLQFNCENCGIGSELKIYDLLGNELKKIVLDENSQTINLAELKTGIYFAFIKNKNSEKTIKLMKFN